jgi:serine protease AprX
MRRYPARAVAAAFIVSARHQPYSRVLLRLAAIAIAALAAAALAPIVRASGGPPGANVPRELLAAAQAHPNDTFAVIVQGRAGSRSSDVADAVQADAAAASDRARAVGRRFRSISGVSGTLTGRELLTLAKRPTIFAITRDEHVSLSDLAAPAIQGDPRVPGTLTAVPPSDGALTTTYSYAWQSCDWTGGSCSVIPWANGATLTLKPGSAGSSIRVAVTAVAADGSTSTTTSEPTGPVAPLFASPFWNIQQWAYVSRLPSAWNALEQGASAHLPAIAVIDSGVDGTVPGVTALSLQVPLTTLTPNTGADGRGHGTFVGNIAAGNAYGHAGAAPGAPLVSLDVIDDNGGAMTSDVIAAADWIYQNKDTYGIRVANMSLVGTAPTSFRYDPLDQAVEKLWLSGVVVVAAAGNYAVDGAQSNVLYAPGNDPFVITVGAADIHGTLPRGDDTAAPWSAYGYTPDGFAKPDLGAPGRSMIAAVPTAATLASTRPDRVVAPGYMELSGTSFAAPVVAGIAADLLAIHPDWTPGQVKGALMLSAYPTSQAAPGSLGVGEVNAAAALAVANPPDADQALEAFLVPDPSGGPTPVFDAAAWQAAVTANPQWAAEMWGTEMWGTAAWSAEMWGTWYWTASAEMWGTDALATDTTGAEMWGTNDSSVSHDDSASTMSDDDWSAAGAP